MGSKSPQKFDNAQKSPTIANISNSSVAILELVFANIIYHDANQNPN